MKEAGGRRLTEVLLDGRNDLGRNLGAREEKGSKIPNWKETKESYNKYHDCIYRKKKSFNATAIN